MNGNDIPEQLPPELVPPSANSLGESVDILRDLLKNDNYSRNTAESPQTKGKVRSFYGNNGPQDSRKDGANYKHDDDEDVPVHRSSSRYVDRKAVRAGTESPSADLAEMQRQLENAAKRIDKVTAEQAARSMEDEDLEREMDELRRRVKRVQDDLDYVSRGPRSFEKDEDRRKLERELLNLLHERLPEVQRKMDDRERRKKKEKDDWSSDRDRRNATFGRYGQLDRDRERDRDRDDYRRYDDRRDEDRGYMRGTFDRSRDGSRERNREDRYYSDRDRDNGRDRYDRDRSDRDRPRSPPRTRTPPPAPAAPVVEQARPPPPAPSPSVAANTKNMSPEERQAFIRAEAARRLQERQQRLGLIAPSVTPTPDTSVEERLAREKTEAAEKASAAEKEAEQRDAARKARLASERGDVQTSASPAPPSVSTPVTPSSPPSVGGKKKAPPPPAPRPRGAPLPSALKKSPAAPPPPRAQAAAPPPPPVAAVSIKAPEPVIDPEEEAFRAREAKLRQAREERVARMKELERMEEEARLEEQRFQERRAVYASRSATSTPVPGAVSAPPAPPPPPVPSIPAAASTNPFHRMQQGAPASAASPATSTSSGFNPFARPAVSSTASPAPPAHPLPTQTAPPPAPPAPAPPVQQQAPVVQSPPVIRSPVPSPAPPAPVAQPAAKQPKKPAYDDDDPWDSPHEKDDDDSDSSDDDRTARQKLAAHLFGTVVPTSPRPESRGSNTRSPAPTSAFAPPPPPPPAPPAPESYTSGIPAAPAPPAPPPPTFSAPIAVPAASVGRGALLQSIASGARLRPTKTVDRSTVLGAGAVLGDAAPPEHIIQPRRSSPSPPPQVEPPVSNGHAHKESVDWYADLAADAAPPPPPPPPPPPALSSVTEEEPSYSYSAVPAINIQPEEPVASEPDLLEDVDMHTCKNFPA